MKMVFKNGHGNYRMVWKVIFALSLYFAVSLISIIIAGLIYQNVRIFSFSSMINDTMDANWGHALCSLISILLLLVVYCILSRKNAETWSNLGFNGYKPARMALSGFLCGVVFCAAYIIPLCIANNLTIEFTQVSVRAIDALLSGLVIYAGISFTEEVTFRGFIQSSIKNEYWSISISALIFAAMHMVNSSYTPTSLIYLAIGGFMLGLMRVTTKGIWFPLGFHLAWNWTEISIFGLGSENPSKRWLYTTVTSETIWTGKDGSSGLAIIMVLLLCVAILFYIKLKQKKQAL